MAFLQLTSTNPDLSYIIKKNPASGMNLISHKQGHLCGWYSNENTSYNVFFKDQAKACSYGDADYNNTLQYSSPLFVLDSLSIFFSENIKKTHEKDIQGFTNTFFVNLTAFANDNLVKNFIKQFPDYVFEINQVENLKQIKISTTKSIGELVNLVATMFALFELRKSEIYVDTSILTKYLQCLNRIDAPYFIRYLFKIHLLRNTKDFNDCRGILENGKFNLTLGDNYLSRVHFALDNLNKNIPTVDIGCGEGKFMNFIAPKVKKYLGFDIDTNCREMAKQKISKNKIDNASIFETQKAFDEVISKQPQFEAIMIEVMEHMPLEEAKKLISKTLAYPNLKSLLITTPNRDFNKHYIIEGRRHDDHHFELNKQEFEDLITSLAQGFKVDFKPIGDSVEGVSTSLGAVITRI